MKKEKKELQLTDEYIKALTGKFDLEIIFSLELSDKQLNNIGSIPQCTSLIYLDLSHNNISFINGLENLINIEYIDLSYNQISDISNFNTFRELISCKLQGNNIPGPLPSFFAEFKKLEKLSFFEVPFQDDPDVNTSNPICEEENYRQDILDSIPQLKWLDGIPRDMEAFNMEDEDNDKDWKEKLNPDKYNFSFDGNTKINKEEIIPKNNEEIVKKNIEEHYNDIQCIIEQAKKQLEDIK